MLTLASVSHHYPGRDGPRVILDRVSLRIDRGERVGILGDAGSGKTTLARLITGQLRPRQGNVLRLGRISWPMTFSAAYHPGLTGAENVMLVAGFNNVDPAHLLAQVIDRAHLGAALFEPVETYAPGMKVRLAIALALAMEFDMYLADELGTTGSAAAQDVFDALLLDRADRRGLVLLSRHPHALRRHCDRILVLGAGSLFPADDLEEAVEIQSLLKREEAVHGEP